MTTRNKRTKEPEAPEVQDDPVDETEATETPDPKAAAVASALLNPARAALHSTDEGLAALDAEIAAEDDDVDLPGSEPEAGPDMDPEVRDLALRRERKVGRAASSSVEFGCGRRPGTNEWAYNIVMRRGTRIRK